MCQPFSVVGSDGWSFYNMRAAPFLIVPLVDSLQFILGCVQNARSALFNPHSILDDAPIVGWDAIMDLDTGAVFKRSVVCPHCNEDYLFTLRAIAENPELKCHGCRNNICLRDSVYEPLVNDVRKILEAIDLHERSVIKKFIN